MGVLFRRKAKLVVGPRAGSGSAIENLRIAFEIEKTSEENPNRAKISVYNLSETTRSMFEQPNIVAVLSAGYGNDTETIFIGDINRVNTIKEGPDRITTFEAGDGEKKVKETVVNKSFAPGTNFTQVLSEITTKLGMPVRTQGVTPEIFSKGVSASGVASDLLTKFLKKQDLEWSVQNGVLVIKPADKPDVISALRLSSETGLVGSPEKREKGLNFKCLLSPKLVPGAPVIIDSAQIKGTFICRTVKHTGDSKQGDWLTEVEAL